MRLNNKALALGLGAFVLTGCSGGGGGNDRPRLPDPVYGEAPQGGYPQSTPPRDDGPPPAPIAAPGPSGPPPLNPDEMTDGPPLSAGPSGTSGRGAERYDEVGYATWYGSELGGGRTASGAPFDPQAFTAAHRTLPLGSYVEVTSLANGRTILVQINDRGPRDGGLLIDLSQASAQALGITGRGAVRVRRITPGPGDMAALRSGQPGSPRADAPPALLAGLRQRLTGAPVAAPPPPVPATAPVRRPVAPPPQAARPPVKAPPAASGGYYVQVAAFSSQARAASLAKSLGGQVVPAGSVWRVRLGPYPSPDKAAQARDAAAARGYGDARVVRED